MNCLDQLPDMHSIIAAANNIGLYSYEYEMLQAAPLSYSEAEGLIADYITESAIDLEAFQQAWHEDFLQNELQSMISEKLAVNNLHEDPALKDVLLQAYRLGLKHAGN